MKVLLTGATGLIGPRVLDRLMERGDKVRVFALPDTVNRIRDKERVEIMTGDVSETEALKRAAQGIEVVYHLAGLLPGNKVEDLMRVNVRGTEAMLQASVACGVRRFVFSSSVSVYSPCPFPFMWPIVEDNPLRAHGNESLKNYGQSKIDAEALVRGFAEEHALECVILRPPVVYGPGAQYVEGLLRMFMTNPRMALAQGQQAGGMQWVHVQDLAAGVVLAGTRPEAHGNVLNIAGGEVFTAQDVMNTVFHILNGGQGQPPVRQYTQPGYSLRYDISKAQQLLGYIPQVTLQQGLEEIVHMLDLRPAWQGARQQFGMGPGGRPGWGGGWGAGRPWGGVRPGGGWGQGQLGGSQPGGQPGGGWQWSLL